MIFVTGDCHGEWGRLGMKNFPEQRRMTKNDCVIVCGDFGFWTPSREREYWMDWLEQKPLPRFLWTEIMKILTVFVS